MKIESCGTVFKEVVHVAPIKNDMLLGFNFLKKHSVRHDMRRDELEVRENIIGLQLGNPLVEPRVAGRGKRRGIPSNSVAVVKC